MTSGLGVVEVRAQRDHVGPLIHLQSSLGIFLKTRLSLVSV